VPGTRRRYGTRPDLPSHHDGWFEPTRRQLARLPQYVDLRRQCPPVYDQGSLNSCTAHALAAAVWFQARKTGASPPALSRLFIYYNERSAERQPRCNVPVSLRDAHQAVERFGVCPERHWRYAIGNFSVRPPARCYNEGLVFRVTRYLRVARNIRHLRACLAQNLPFSMGLSVYSSFESRVVRRSGVVPMPKPSEALLGGHAVLAVGYDDARKCFVVRNSWGPRWGKSGYFLLPYEFIVSDKQYTWDFWTVMEVAAT
jgi:C1A family cysteine protease